MTLYRVEDTASVDAFTLPSLFDTRAGLYQEWHDFVFYDRKTRIFGLLNFGVHGNPYDSKRGWGSALTYFVDPTRNIFSEVKLIPLSQLQVSSYSPDFISDDFSVVLQKNNSFDIMGKMAQASFDLNFEVFSPPATDQDVFMDVLKVKKPNVRMLLAAQEMNRQWESWVELPRLLVKGDLKINNKKYTLNSDQGYQDHEGGCFDIGATWGWDTGVIFCDHLDACEPARVDFLIYRYGPTSDLSYGGVFVETKDGKKCFFDNRKLKVASEGTYDGNISVMPGITKLLYPDYHPEIPKTTTFSAKNNSDSIEISFKPVSLCSIVNASLENPSEVVFNEMFCDVELNGVVGGQSYECTLPCWFESVRPRKRVENLAVDA